MSRSIQAQFLFNWEVINFLYQLAKPSLQLAQLDEMNGCAEVVGQSASFVLWQHDSLMEHAENEVHGQGIWI
jgi:hypothetical protein